MPTPRPLAFALVVAISAGGLAPRLQAAGKKARKPAAVSPACQDFYADANRQWLAATPVPESGAVSALGQLGARAQQQQRELLDAAMRAPANRVQTLLGDFWASGLDEAAVERDGAAPIAPLLKRIDAIRKPRDIAPAIAALHQVGIPVAFQFNADIDLRDLDRHLGYFSQGGVGLPDPAFYTRDDAQTRELMARYADYVRKILALTGVPTGELETQSRLVLDLETRIAAAARPLQELRDPRNNFAAVAAGGLDNQYRHLRLGSFLAAQGVSDDTVSLANPALFGQIDALVARLKPSQWQAYLRWRVGDAMAPYLSQPWQHAAFGFRGKLLLGQAEPAPRWQQVLDTINLAAGPMLGHEYVARYLDAATAQQAIAIAGQVRSQLIDRIEQGRLFSDAAKAEALGKLAKLRIEIGSPPDALDDSVQPMGRGSFGGNMLIASTWRHRQEMRRIGRGNAHRRWDVLPQQPALAYDLAHDRLIVTAAMLQPPVLDAAMTTGARYGAFGALVGHELSHAVDGIGRHVDARGEVHDWWTAQDATRWQAQQQSVVSLYTGLPWPGLDGVRVDATLTRDENLADVAGLELASAALQAAQPEADANVQRAFYTAWAQLWGQQASPEEARLRARQDVRAPGRWRANIPVMQQAGFAEAFGCKAGTPMRPQALQPLVIFD